MGNVVKALTRVNSRSNAVIEELPSNRKAASVAATPTRAAGPTEAARSVPHSNAEQTSTAKKLTAEPSDSSVKKENMQNLPRYMRPLNRQVRDLAKQMENVKERVQSLRTSLHSKGSKKGSMDRS
jgi:predicted RNase H-like nuclease (RuvC/YqgF family)